MAGVRKVTEVTPLQVEARKAFYTFSKAPSYANTEVLIAKCQRLSYAFVHGAKALAERDAAAAAPAEQSQAQPDAPTAPAIENAAEAEATGRGRRRASAPEEISAAA